MPNSRSNFAGIQILAITFGAGICPSMYECTAADLGRAGQKKLHEVQTPPTLASEFRMAKPGVDEIHNYFRLARFLRLLN